MELRALLRTQELRCFQGLKSAWVKTKRMGFGHVLGHFSDKEREYVNDAVKDAMDATIYMIQDDVDRAMNLYNAKRLYLRRSN